MNGNRNVYSKIEFVCTFIITYSGKVTSIEVNKYKYIYCTNVYIGIGIEISMLSVKYFYKILYRSVSM
jgi:hypothetical protein